MLTVLALVILLGLALASCGVGAMRVLLERNRQARPGVRIAYYAGTFMSASLLLYAIGGTGLFIYCVQCDPGLFARHWSWVPHPYTFVLTLLLAFAFFWPVALATLGVRYFVLRNGAPSHG